LYYFELIKKEGRKEGRLYLSFGVQWSETYIGSGSNLTIRNVYTLKTL